MKNLKHELLFLFLFCNSLFAFAGLKVPEAVKAAFVKQFPAATNVKWGKENAREWESNFVMEGKTYSANYSSAGVWLETERQSSVKELPENVTKTFYEKHHGIVIREVMIIETSKGEIRYEIEFKQGLKLKEYLYSADGVEIKL